MWSAGPSKRSRTTRRAYVCPRTSDSSHFVRGGAGMSVSYVSPVTRAVAAGITLVTLIWSIPGSTTRAQESRPSVGIADTERFGPILVDADGWALYTWVVDRPGESTCYGSCVESWPPALVDGPVIPPAGLAGS